MSVVYFIKNPRGHVKIGLTKNRIASRLKNIQTGSAEKLELIAAVSGAIELERRLHERFAVRRLSGEWFDFSGGMDELLAVIDGLHAVEVSLANSKTPSYTRSLLQSKQWIEACASYRVIYLDETSDQAHKALAKELEIGIGALQNIVRLRVQSVDADFFDALKDLRHRYCEQELEALEADFRMALEIQQKSAAPKISEAHAARSALETARDALARMKGARR